MKLKKEEKKQSLSSLIFFYTMLNEKKIKIPKFDDSIQTNF